MRNTILVGLALAAFGSTEQLGASTLAIPSSTAAEVTDASLVDGSREQRRGVRVWLDHDRDWFRPTDRPRVLLRSDRDAYVAVFHIDTNGDLEVLYPRSARDDGWLPGGRTLELGSPGGWSHLRTRGGEGIGYVFAVALDEPLELHRVRHLFTHRRAGWDADRTIWGDPFYAIDEIVRAVVPEWAYGYESVDHHTYHVGRRYDYPRYACYQGYGDWYDDRGRYSDGCDRVIMLLRERPYYYDTRQWHGSRREYYERPRVAEPVHRYKESTASADAPRVRTRAYEARPEPLSRPAESWYRQEQQEQQQERRPPARQRPTLERRPQEPVRRSEPRRIEPRREEPRRSEPPAEEKESSPPERSAPRVRPPVG